MHYADMIRDVVSGFQEVLQQEQELTKNPKIIPEPIDHVANAVQSIQQQLATQLKQIQEMMQTMHMQYAAAQQHNHQYYVGHRYHGRQKKFAAEEEAVLDDKETGEVAVIARETVI